MIKVYRIPRNSGYLKHAGKVYFAQALIDGMPLVKIGFYSGRYDIIKTLRFKYKTDFKILAVIRANVGTEKKLHEKFFQHQCLVFYPKDRKGCRVYAMDLEFFEQNSELLGLIKNYLTSVRSDHCHG